MTILVHSCSKSVIGVLKHAKKRAVKIKVIVTDTQPFKLGQLVVDFCEENEIPC